MSIRAAALSVVYMYLSAPSRLVLTHAIAFASVRTTPSRSISRHTRTRCAAIVRTPPSPSSTPPPFPPASHDRSRPRLSMSTSGSTPAGLSDIGADPNARPPPTDDAAVTSWRDRIAVSVQRSRKVRGGNFVQIATVDRGTLEPRCRTVVFRGFLATAKTRPNGGGDGGYSTMKMITDRRSNKVAEASSESGGGDGEGARNVELVWWFSKSNEQYRIRGALRFVGHDHPDADLVTARKGQWGNLSDSAREQFYWKDPGVPYQGEDGAGDLPVGGRGEDGKVLSPPDDFLLMLLEPARVDYLRLGDNYRQVDEKVPGGDGDWTMARMNP